jgi:hypothetical protein
MLDLSYIRLSPKAVTDLASLKGLTNIHLKRCGLTTSEVQRLGNALPGARIELNIGLIPDFQDM